MKAVILAGGFGTRISEESHLRPKPLVDIGENPILWHILKTYSHYGIHEFIICAGYRGYQIKEYFCHYFMHQFDVTVDIANNTITTHGNVAEPWIVHVVDTGLETMTGGRLKRVGRFLKDEDQFCLTYGDGLADVDIARSIQAHKASGKLATMTVVSPPGRFGTVEVDDENGVTRFLEKPPAGTGTINAGFFVCEHAVLDYIEGDDTVWERDPLQRLAAEGQLNAYRHDGFWQPMDTLREKNQLQSLWESGRAPWKLWE